MEKRHKIQKNILKNLLINKKLPFSKLNSDRIPSDQFSFHLRRLIKENIIEKGPDGLYRLTIKGKEYANTFDIDSEKIIREKQAKIGVLVVVRNKEKKILIQQRLKEPYYGYYGFVTGKVKWGETIYEAATRESREETGLEAKNLILKGIEHKIDYSLKKELLEDKFFYIIEASNLRGRLIESFNCGANHWLEKKEINKLPKLFGDVSKIIKAVNQNNLVFFEDKYYVKEY